LVKARSGIALLCLNRYYRGMPTLAGRLDPLNASGAGVRPPRIQIREIATIPRTALGKAPLIVKERGRLV
jgi:hypothetical protein